MQSLPGQLLSTQITIPTQKLSYQYVHSLDLSIKVQTNNFPADMNFFLPLDVYFLMDISGSMNLDEKFLNIKASLQMILEKKFYGKKIRVCLIVFNDVASIIFDLQEINSLNKTNLMECINNLVAKGSTNMGDALKLVWQKINENLNNDKNRMVTVFIFTDGLNNKGLNNNDIIKYLNKFPSGIEINTIGYGYEHDGNFLNQIATLSNSGIYYFIENVANISLIFSECINRVLNICNKNVIIKLIAQDGCRITKINSCYSIKQFKEAKEYEIPLGNMSSGDSINILLRISLKKFNFQLLQHILNVETHSVNIYSGHQNVDVQSITVDRIPSTSKEIISYPDEIQKHIIRFQYINVMKLNFSNAYDKNIFSGDEFIKLLRDVNEFMEKMNDPKIIEYCTDLLSDIKDLMLCFNDKITFFKYGKNFAHAFYSMYLHEKSNGTWCLSSIQQIISFSKENIPKIRGPQYAYTTYEKKSRYLNEQNIVEEYLKKMDNKYENF